MDARARAEAEARAAGALVTFLMACACGAVSAVVLAGWWLCLVHIVTGLLLCLTIIAFPFGIANFKLAGLAFAPLGKLIIPADSAAR